MKLFLIAVPNGTRLVAFSLCTFMLLHAEAELIDESSLLRYVVEQLKSLYASAHIWRARYSHERYWQEYLSSDWHLRC